MVGCGMAFVDSMKGPGNTLADMIPVDVVSNMMVAAAVERARHGNNNNNNNNDGKMKTITNNYGSPSSTTQIPVYNCVSGAFSPVSWNEIVNMVSYWFNVHPTEGAIWTPDWRFYDSFVINRANMMLRTGLPALVLDLINRARGVRPRYVKMYDRFLKVDDVLTYFVSHEWKWKADTTVRLLDCMSQEEKKVYR